MTDQEQTEPEMTLGEEIADLLDILRDKIQEHGFITVRNYLAGMNEQDAS